ncbi:MAG: tRNA (adenosine(37)-N6)-dimethylallyltransferase MiaA, partial [Pseudomonadota bacterium]|nr:tRNA (adenosine(37)-N6)-dimethylallyltransferase MiaA [Pseudomonadota bacterium]
KLQGWPAMHRRLQGIDPAMAEKLNRHDGQRIGRALEIYEQSGYPMSEWLAKPVYNSFDYPTIRLVLEPEIRNVLHERIAVRFRNMLTAGLVDELQGLKKCYELHESMPSMRCVGYRQAWKYLDGLIDFKEMEEAGIAATRQLARRQLTWLRSMKDVNRVNCFDENVVEKSYQLVLQALDRIKG